MKNYFYLFVVLFAVIVSGYGIKKANLVQASNVLALVNLQALASVENGSVDSGEGEGESGCYSTWSIVDEMQTCQGRKKIARTVETYGCVGSGSGSCRKGFRYTFFDCEGMLIGTNDYVMTQSCK